MKFKKLTRYFGIHAARVSNLKRRLKDRQWLSTEYNKIPMTRTPKRVLDIYNSDVDKRYKGKVSDDSLKIIKEIASGEAQIKNGFEGNFYNKLKRKYDEAAYRKADKMDDLSLSRPINWRRKDRKVFNEMAKNISKKGGKIGYSNGGNNWYDYSNDIIGIDKINSHNRPEALGHEWNHRVTYKNGESPITSKSYNNIQSDINKNGMDYTNPEHILNYVQKVNDEHNDADRGKVMGPYLLGGEFVTKGSLNRYNKTKTNYNESIGGYIPPSTSYHMDPEAKERMFEQLKLMDVDKKPLFKNK